MTYEQWDTRRRADWPGAKHQEYVSLEFEWPTDSGVPINSGWRHVVAQWNSTIDICHIAQHCTGDRVVAPVSLRNALNTAHRLAD